MFFFFSISFLEASKIACSANQRQSLLHQIVQDDLSDLQVCFFLCMKCVTCLHSKHTVFILPRACHLFFYDDILQKKVNKKKKWEMLHLFFFRFHLEFPLGVKCHQVSLLRTFYDYFYCHWCWCNGFSI